MKRSYLLYILIGAFTFSCAESKKESATQESIETSTVKQVSLTPEQINLAGISTSKPQKRVISGYVFTNGRLELPPQNMVSVHAAASGFVRQVNFLPGDVVKKGQLLCILENPEYAQKQQLFLETKAQLSFLQKELERKKMLAKTDATSQKSLQETEADYKVHQARYKGLKAELGLMGFNVNQVEKNENIQTRLNIYSPISGFVDQVNVNLGKLISPNDLLYQLLDKSNIHLELKVFAKDLDKLHEGQNISFNLPGEHKNGEHKTYEATVHLVGRMIESETNTAVVHGHLKNTKAHNELAPGTYVNAKIQLGHKEVLALPKNAVLDKEGKQYVYIKTAKGFEPYEITSGITNDEFVEVVDFDLNQEVVVKGATYLKGMEI